MAENSGVKTLTVGDELHACQACGYERGFHVAFRRRDGGNSLKLILVCPNCAARYDIGCTV